MKLIDSEKFLQDMADLYRQAGWDEREVHFSLADLRSNIGMEDVILIPRREEDVVPVIRCKDCDLYGIYETKKDGSVDMRYKPSWCFLWRASMKAKDYCSCAVRREDSEID